MLFQGGTFSVKNCAACGGEHDALEVQYVYPPENDGGQMYDLVATCPATGAQIYITTKWVTHGQ